MILSNKPITKINLWKHVEEFVCRGDAGKILFIVPTNRKIRELKKRIISNAPDNSTSKLYLHTLETFSKQILNELFVYQELSEAARGVFLSNSIKKVKLEYYTRYKDSFPYGSVQKVGAVISKYKESGISPELLILDSNKLDENEKLKAKDISRIYKFYQEYCEQNSIYELGDFYQKLNSISKVEFENQFHEHFKGIELVIVSGFTEFTPLEIQIISKIIGINSLDSFVELDYYKYNLNIFSGVKKLYNSLIDIGLNEVTDLQADLDNSVIQKLRNNLFKPFKNSTPTVETQCKIISGISRENEVELISKEIKKLIRSGKTDPENICVVFNLIDNYSNIIKYEFSKFGIPLNLTDRTAYSETTPVSGLINLLEITESDYYYKSILRAFNNRYINTSVVNVSNLLQVAEKLKLVRGYKNWHKTLTNIIDSKDNLFDLDILKIEEAKESIEFIHSLLKPFNKKLSIKEFIEQLKEVIIKLNLNERLTSNISPASEINIKAIAKFYQLVKETLFYTASGSVEDKLYDLPFYIENLRVIARKGRFNIKEKSDYGVLVTTMNEIRGLNFEYVFIGGMVDGDLPTRYTPEIFFSENFVKKESEHLSSERLLFYQTIKCFNKGLYLSYPVSDSKREFTKSNFLLDLNNVLAPNEIVHDDYKKFIFCEDDLQLNYSSIKKSPHAESLVNSSNIKFNINEIDKRIEIEKSRLSSDSTYEEYKGILKTDESEYLKKLFNTIPDKEFSASELETYAKCPYKYFLERIIKIQASEEPSEEIEAIELGSLLHSILYDFYSKIFAEGIKLKGCSEKTFHDSENILFKLAEKRLASFSNITSSSFFDIEKILGINGDRRQSILYKFLVFERNDEDALNPEFFEVSFGRVKKLETDLRLSTGDSVELEGVKLKGKIDRIDVDDSKNLFAVTDYKLGYSIPNKSDLEGGISIQLPFYMLCAQSLLKDFYTKDLKPAFMNIFSLKYNDGNFGKTKLKFGRSKDFDFVEFNKSIMSAATENIKKFVLSISNGKFPLSSLENRKLKVCAYCDFKTQCRIDAIKQ
jgi:ATP-dependent helicase/nuclease subunit B